MNEQPGANIHKSRAQHLLSQSRYDAVIRELQQHLAEVPDDAVAHGMMAVSYACLKNKSEAIRWSNLAMQLGPNIGYCSYARAFVLKSASKYREAEAAIKTGLNLNPSNADYHSLLGSIRYARNNWKGSIEAADQGLAIDAEHVGCLNTRAIALMRLGKKSLAEESIRQSLKIDPENAVSHTNLGWIYRSRNQHDLALQHFEAALRINPNTHSTSPDVPGSLAKMYTSYKAWHPMHKLSDGVDKVFKYLILGIIALSAIPILFFGALIVLVEPSWISTAIAGLFALFILYRWTGRSFKDLLLCVRPSYGISLNSHELIASNWVGLCLLGIVVSLGCEAIHSVALPKIAAIFYALLAIPAARIESRTGSIRVTMIFLTVMYTAIAVLEIVRLLTTKYLDWPMFPMVLLVLPALAFAVYRNKKETAKQPALPVEQAPGDL